MTVYVLNVYGRTFWGLTPELVIRKAERFEAKLSCRLVSLVPQPVTVEKVYG